MVAQALMLGLIAGIGILDGRIFGQMMFDRPLVTGLFVGIVLGDVKQGIIIGAQLELIWMGIAGIGAATPPDVVTGGILGTAFAIISGSGVEVALALAVPIAVLAQTLGVVVRIANTYFAHKADKYAKEANYRGMAISMWIPVCLFFLSTFLPTFLAILLGADQVSNLINSIPKVILDGMGVAGSLLPAIGFALLMDMLFSKKMAPFFFIGFLAAAYGGMNITAIALFAVCLAFILHFYIEPKKELTDSTQDNLTEGEIDFD
ncbi:PTS mannose/fructose/sorbose/N-acetylgalactosamine transporter subunit IIC [Enterococcus avium]